MKTDRRIIYFKSLFGYSDKNSHFFKVEIIADLCYTYIQNISWE
ncbi:hypothetical protein HMPREF0554_2202 [Pseudoleptotrichia goodfellowii F0264]|uniref:Uncharacterized protein n=1 Tax=Pseudoleptotrichia goodfellowii F0264 TaxID=596323 RepID=D0GKT3_9FUSO|nr:hypothetical protein HMPREF0554_2202 [Pseudoleptotrichia goodfellowii F0264]